MNARILFLSALLCIGYMAGCHPLPAAGATPRHKGELNMLPTYSIDDVVDVCFRNSELFSNPNGRSSLTAEHSYFEHGTCCELGASDRLAARYSLWMSFSSIAFSRWLVAALLFFFVYIVVAACAKKKVIRIDAARVIATMARAKAINDYFDLKLEGNAVSFFNYTVQAEGSVTFCFSSRPNPTLPQVWHVWWNRAVFVDLFPKVFMLSGIQLEKFRRFGQGLFIGLHNNLCELLAVFSATNAANRVQFQSIEA